MIGEILQFLTPSLSNPLEVFFFSIIVLGLLLSLITSQVFGQPANWEKNWRAGLASMRWTLSTVQSVN